MCTPETIPLTFGYTTTGIANLAQLATISVPFIAAIALLIAWLQISIGKSVARRASAYNAYQEFLKLSIQFPQCGFGKQSEIENSKELMSQYRWFIANMLLSFEEILLVCGNEKDWTNNISAQLTRHAWFLKTSKSVIRGDWKPCLKKLIEKAIAEHNKNLVEQRDKIAEPQYLKFKIQ